MIKHLAPLWKAMPQWLQRIIIYQLNSKYVLGTNAIIFNDQGQVWLQKHRFWPQYPWGFPGGHVGFNETPQQAIVREIKEELSTSFIIDAIIDIRPITRSQRNLVVFFAGQFTAPIGVIDDTEIIEAAYFSLDNLPSDLYPGHRHLLEQYAHTKLEKP